MYNSLHQGKQHTLTIYTVTTNGEEEDETIKQRCAVDPPFERSARVQCITKQHRLDDSIDQCAASSIALYAISTGDSGEPYPHL
jgi:hypothetical protein